MLILTANKYLVLLYYGSSMKFIVTAVGSDGDINPMIEIAKELVSRGHRVEFCANGYFAGKVNEAGLGYLELGEERLYLERLRKPGVWDPRKGFAAVWEFVTESLELSYEIIKKNIEPGNTILVGTTLVMANRVLQEETGIKCSTVHLSPCCILSAHEPMTGPGYPSPTRLPLWIKHAYMSLLDLRLLDRFCRDDVNKFRANHHNLPPVKSIFRKWVNSPDQVICAFPEWFAKPMPDWPPNSVCTGIPIFRKLKDETLSQEVKSFLSQGAPPVVITPGSANAQTEDYFTVALECLKNSGLRAIFVAKHKNEVLENLPENIIYSRYEPFDLLFPEAAVVVHHGGIGTSAQCLNAGVPQMITPFAHDQFDNAARLEKLGVGRKPRVLNEFKFTADRAPAWRKCLSQILCDQNMKEKCKTIQKKMQSEPEPAKLIADNIEKLIS